MSPTLYTVLGTKNGTPVSPTFYTVLGSGRWRPL